MVCLLGTCKLDADFTPSDNAAMTDTDIHSYIPAEGHGLPHDPFNAVVGPRPIGWISTKGKSGRVNLAPYSFFNGFNYVPPIIGFSSIGYKDTIRNIEETGEFVWNLTTRELAEQMNTSCFAAAPEVNEFQLAGLTEAPSRVVAPPRVRESPVSFECKVTQVLRLKTAAGADIDSWMTFGEVVAIHIAKYLLKDGVYQTAAAHPVLRGGGPADYFELGEHFKMYRPK
jgi:flavin reductase (DIM6/NTAB) family NADH-FMN oxidoreductase RutF